MATCKDCNGSGMVDPNCPDCGRTGRVDDRDNEGTMVCPTCNGDTSIQCNTCGGTGVDDDFG